jgi:hypothetical protein
MPNDPLTIVVNAVAAALPANFLLAAIWVLTAIVLATALVYAWQRLLDR